MPRLTIGETAELLAKVELDLPAEYFSRQLRLYASRGLLGHLDYRGHGRTAAALLGEAEVCQARLLSIMARTGLHQDQLYDATRCLNNVPSVGHDGPPPSPAGLRGVLKRLRAGERWFFVLKIGPWSRSENAAVGEGRGGFYQKLDFDVPDFSKLVTLVFDCGHLFGPLLEQLDGMVVDDDDEPAPQPEEFIP